MSICPIQLWQRWEGVAGSPVAVFTFATSTLLCQEMESHHPQSMEIPGVLTSSQGGDLLLVPFIFKLGKKWATGARNDSQAGEWFQRRKMLVNLPAPPRQRSCQPWCGMSFITLSPQGLEIILLPGGSMGHTCNLCLPELSAVVPKACFWLQRQQWSVGDMGRGCGFQWVLVPAGMGAGGECPGKHQLCCCRVCCSRRGTSHYREQQHSSSLPQDSQHELNPNPQKTHFWGGMDA